MTFVHVMEVTVDEVIDVVAMRYGVVTAARTVHVGGRVAAAGVAGGARRWICRRDRNDALIDMIAVHRVQMAVVQVIDVAVVPDRAVTALGTVRMAVVGVDLVGGHLLAVLSQSSQNRWTGVATASSERQRSAAPAATITAAACRRCS